MAKKKRKKQTQQKKKSALKKTQKVQVKATPKKSTKKPKKKAIKAKSTKKKEELKQAAPKHSKLATTIKHKLAKDLRKPAIITVSLLALFVIFQISSLILTANLLNRAAPGTTVAGADLTSKEMVEAYNVLVKYGGEFMEQPVVIKFNNLESDFLPAQLGIELDTRATIAEVNFVKFDNSNLATILLSAWNGEDVPYYSNVDIDQARQLIEEEFAFGDQKTRNAYLAFEGGVLTIVPEVEGKAIDIRKLYQDLKDRSSNLSSDPVEVSTFDYPPIVTVVDLEQQLDEIKDKLNQTIALSYENFNFNLKLIDNIDWVRFGYTDILNIGDSTSMALELPKGSLFELPDPISLKNQLQIEVLDEPFETYIDEKLSPLLETAPSDVKIYTDEEGTPIIEGKGENGQIINRDFLLKGLTLAINSKINEVPIPIQFQPANVEVSEDLQKLGIKELISTGRSAFAGSTWSRIHNINTGIGKFQGHIIKPGETFSFNTILGPVEAYTGFKPELVIKAEGTIPEYGGGLCQVSSTMYRAALLAGLPVVERAPHSYAVSYYSQVYGYGLDATIYPGVHDVKFTNNTPAHILIQGYTEGTKAFFKFYGTGDGRSVELEGPYLGGYHYPGPAQVIESPTLAPGQRKQMEVPHTGFNATWYRYLTDAAGETVKETIGSQYRAIPAKILVGPGEAEVPAEAPAEA
ncbi:VanW family protein [Patescibacteria group bacterium]